MPARKRRHDKKQAASAEELDPVTRFATMLRESEEREQAEQRRAAEDRQRRRALEAARQELQTAIDAARRARSSGTGVSEADAVWREAKARVIELETGERPDWAPAPTDGSS